MSPKLRKLIPDEALFRRRAGDEPLRDLARELFGVAEQAEPTSANVAIRPANAIAAKR